MYAGEIVVRGAAALLATGKIVDVIFRWYRTEAGDEAEVRVAGRETPLRFPLCSGALPALTAFLAEEGPPGGERATPTDPVNIDGSPRASKLVDRLHRPRGEPESMAAD